MPCDIKNGGNRGITSGKGVQGNSVIEKTDGKWSSKGEKKEEIPETMKEAEGKSNG